MRQDVLSILKKKNVTIVELSKSVNHAESLAKIRKFQPDLIISIAGNEIFKKELISIPTHGIINLHTALLPRYRGLLPSFWVLKNNEVETGVSVFYVDEGIDSGPIIVQKRVQIGDMSQEKLIKVTKKLGVEAIIEACNDIENNRVTLIENNDEVASYFGFPSAHDVKEFKINGKRFF